MENGEWKMENGIDVSAIFVKAILLHLRVAFYFLPFTLFHTPFTKKSFL